MTQLELVALTFGGVAALLFVTLLVLLKFGPRSMWG